MRSLRILKKTNLVILVFIISCASIFSQSKIYNFKNLSTLDGLSQSTAIPIHHDKIGQIWIGTRNGLNKYNGTKFTIFRSDAKDSLSISNNDINTIEEDQSGNLWIGTFSGLNRYDPVLNTFKRYYHKKNIESLSNNTIWVIKEVNDEEIWIGTSRGLSIYNKRTDRFTNSFYDPENAQSISSNQVKSIFVSSDGTIWIGTTNGLSKLIGRDKGILSFENFKLKDDFNKNKKRIGYFDIIEGLNNTILVGTNNAGVLEFDVSKKILKPFFSKEEQKLVHKNVRKLSFDKDGSLWVGTYDGLYIVSKDRRITHLSHNPNDPNSLSKNSIKYIFTDKKGSIWVSTYYGGVNIWDVSNINFINYTTRNGVSGLNYDVVSSVETDGENQMFFGTEGGGINILDKNKKNIRYITKKNSKQLASNNIKSLFYSDGGNLWIGSVKSGLMLYDTKKGTFKNDQINKGLKKYLQRTGVYSIKLEGKHILWIGTYGKGLVRYDLRSNKFKTYIKSYPLQNSLSSNLVRTLLLDSNKNLWVGTQRGLNVINKKGTLKHYMFSDEMHVGQEIACVFEDSKKQIWVGTSSNGFFKFNGTEFESVDLVYKNKKVVAIHSILEDQNANLWISSNQGLIKYNSVNKEILIYNIEDGLVGNEYNNNASLKIGDSIFYFGGTSGVTSFNSNKITINNYAPKVIITDLKIKNKLISVGDKQGILKKGISYTNSITLSYDKANFSLEFAIPNFINPSSNEYKYRLLGLEDQWNTTHETTAHYTIQNPGNYTFEVKGANNDGIWNEEPTTLKIKVQPAPWRSWWAFLIYTLLILSALYTLIWILKSKEVLKYELDLEHLENVRKEETNKMKLQFFTNVSHEFRTPLTLILGPLQQLLADYKGSHKMFEKLLVIENNANQLLKLINRLMDFRKFENNQFELQAAEGDINKFLKEIYFSFSELAKEEGYNYTFESSDEQILVYFDASKLERVFYNLISNAFRFTPKKGTINLNISKVENNVVITIKDNGIGIPKEYSDKIFKRFFEIPIQKNPKEGYNTGTGIGLSIVKNIVKLHKGNIQVKSNSTEGSIFEVTLPLGKEHLLNDEVSKSLNTSDNISQYTSQLKEQIENFNEDVEDLSVDKNKPVILIVEDNEPLRMFIHNLLKDEYNIIQAENGEVGLEKAINNTPDLVISDIVMPKMVGTELCAKLKENLKTSHIPVILLTARTSLVYKVDGFESGADDYISKPFNIDEFKLRIKSIFDFKQRLKDKFLKEGKLIPSEFAVSSVDEKLLKKAFEIVEENLSNDQFDIPLFCDELGVGRSMLFSKIKAWTNFTPNEFIQEIRLKRAAQFLEQNKINISEICYKVGFKNPRYFSKCFLKKHGETPTQYRNKFSVD